MKNNVKEITIMQRNESAVWNYYTLTVAIKNDVLKLDGTRFVKVIFMNDPNKLGYYPRQNDILLDSVNLTAGTKLSFNYSQSANDGFGIMFLTQFEDNTYTFAPLLNLEENHFINAGSYLPQNLLANSVDAIWGWLTGGNQYLLFDETNTITADITKPANYSYATQSTISDIFKQLIGRLRGGWDVNFSYTIGATRPVITIIGTSKATTNQAPYFLEFKRAGVLDISTRSRNKETGTSLVIGYDDTGTTYGKWAYLDKNLAVKLASIPTDGTLTFGTTPRVQYSSITEMTDSALIESASSVLDTSLLINNSQVVFKLKADKLLIDTDAPKIGQFINVSGYNSNSLLIAQLRELDFASNLAVIGDNDDITLGD